MSVLKLPFMIIRPLTRFKLLNPKKSRTHAHLRKSIKQNDSNDYELLHNAM